MAEHQAAIFLAKVHTTSSTVAEVLAILTFTCPHPLAVSVGSKALFPHIHEIVGIDVSLMIVCTNAGTGRDAAVHKH